MFNLKNVFHDIHLRRIIFLIPLILIYALLLLTGDIQEDAYITIRTAFNLADHGELSFNLGEDYSGATSYLYPFLIALIRLASGEHAITIVLIVNAIALLVTTYYLSRILTRIFNFSVAIQDLLWFVFSIAPITLLMASRGMEAPYVALLFVVGLYKVQDAPRRLSSLIPVLILPFVRPDAIAFSLILTGLSYMVRPRLGVLYLVTAISGGVIQSLAYYFTIGSFFPNTVIAKGYGIISSLHFLLDRELWIYFESHLFALVKTKYLVSTNPFFTVFALGLSTILIYKIWFEHRSYFAIMAAIFTGIWAVPAAYGITDAVYIGHWYFWPSQLLYQGVLIAGIFFLALNFLHQFTARWVIGGSLLVFLGFAILQLVVCYSNGVQESGYRSSVGKYIYTQAKDDDILYLEPAGYIPYFAKIQTIDSFGLVSKIVRTYKKNYPLRWEIELLMKEKPDFLVTRPTKWNGDSPYEQEAVEWIDHHYETIRIFEYNPEDFTSISFLQWILEFGDHTNYHVLKLRE